MTTRRETLKGVALLAVADKLTDGGLAPVVEPTSPQRKHPVLPPGARDDFSRHCIACGACMAACPENVLVPSFDWRRFGQPEMDFRKGRCLLGCVRCADICPAGAFNPLQREIKSHVHIGVAVWNRSRCLRTGGERCNACIRKCPVQAIADVKGIPTVDAAVCIGCGACEHVCPVRPEPAIHVNGYERQFRVTPMTENDLMLEMQQLIVSGKTLAIARNGVILKIETERGLKPLVAAYDAGLLKGSIVFDRAVGRAAAAFYAAAGAATVRTLLAGEGAEDICRKAGVELLAERTVPRILNRERSGSCPMEQAVVDLNDNQKIIEAVRATLERISAK